MNGNTSKWLHLLDRYQNHTIISPFLWLNEDHQKSETSSLSKHVEVEKILTQCLWCSDVEDKQFALVLHGLVRGQHHEVSAVRKSASPHGRLRVVVDQQFSCFDERLRC